MSTQAPSPVTRLLARIGKGDKRAADQLFPLVYNELRAIARAQLADERPGQTLQPTALVHEAYLRLVTEEDRNLRNRSHFMAAAARAMRRILIERARAKLSLKRGQRPKKTTLEEFPQEQPELADLLALDQALERLQQHDEDMARVVELRYFLGLKIGETAQVMEASERTTSRRWTRAKAWLYRELNPVSG